MADYTGLNSSERSFDRSPTQTTILQVRDPRDDSPERKGSETPEQAVIRSRKHPIYAVREQQLITNILGLRGGRPYVNARLARFPGEPKLMFEGGQNRQGRHIQGRREQTHVVPYLTRVALKINQFVFGPGVKRDGISEDVDEDINREGQSVDAFMREASELITACGWCWIGIDAPVVTSSTTQADVNREKIRPYWQLYTALEVVDWHYDDLGNLKWLLLEGTQMDSMDATQARNCSRCRWLWTERDVTTYIYGDGKNGRSKDEIVRQETMPHSFGIVPFVAAGVITADPHIFDSLEGIQKTIMDLQSANRQNYFEGVFPQRYFPQSYLDQFIDQKTKAIQNDRVGMAIGNHDAILVGDGEQPPGVIMPESAPLDSMRSETEYLKKELFETAGLLLRTESRASQTAEAKAFDHLEVEQGLRERAQVLEEAEREAVQISKIIDPQFAEWEPVYPTDFGARDFVKQMQAYVMLSNVSMPVEVQRLVLSNIVEGLEAMGVALTDEQLEAAKESINNMEDAVARVPQLPMEDGE